MVNTQQPVDICGEPIAIGDRAALFGVKGIVKDIDDEWVTLDCGFLPWLKVRGKLVSKLTPPAK